MPAIDPGTIHPQPPVADVRRLLDEIESAFSQDVLGGLKWTDELDASSVQAIKDDGLPLRVAICVAWKNALGQHIDSTGLAGSIKSLIDVVSDIETIARYEFETDAPALRMVWEANNNLTGRLRTAMWELRNRLNAAAVDDSTEQTETPTRHVEHLEQRKIKLPTNPDVAEVWNAVHAVESGTANVAEICRSIAEKRGCSADSLRSMFNTWRRKNKG